LTENQKTYATISDVLSMTTEDFDAPSGLLYKIRALAPYDFVAAAQDFPFGDFEGPSDPDELREQIGRVPMEKQVGFLRAVLARGVASMNISDTEPTNPETGVVNASDLPLEDQLAMGNRILVITGTNMQEEGDAPLTEGQRDDSPSDGKEVRDAAPQDPDAAVPTVSD